MDDLIEALHIFAKYVSNNSYAKKYPIHCEHDVLYINPEITLDMVSDEDVNTLEELGFFFSEDEGGFISFKFGSC